MKKVLPVISFISVFISIWVKAKWISISGSHNQQELMKQEFYEAIPQTFIVIADLLAIISLSFFIGTITTETRLAVRFLILTGIVVQSGYLFLELWQFL